MPLGAKTLVNQKVVIDEIQYFRSSKLEYVHHCEKLVGKSAIKNGAKCLYIYNYLSADTKLVEGRLCHSANMYTIIKKWRENLTY